MLLWRQGKMKHIMTFHVILEVIILILFFIPIFCFYRVSGVCKHAGAIFWYIHRGGFRGDDLVTCHPLFSDMTLQSQILVIESLFLTSISKFIRKYLLSRQFSYMHSSCSNPLPPLSNLTTIFFRKNYR